MTDVVLRTRTGEPGREATADAAPPAADGLFDEPVTPETIQRDQNKIASAITKRYCELEPMSKYPIAHGVITRAVDSGRFSGEVIMAAVERLAKEGRGLTLETLRVELVGFTPRTNGTPTRAPLRERLKGGAA